MSWPKGKSRNLSPDEMSRARALIEALRRALNSGRKHITLGDLSIRKVAVHLKVSPKSVQNWLKLTDWPPAWALDYLRTLLRDFP